MKRKGLPWRASGRCRLFACRPQIHITVSDNAIDTFVNSLMDLCNKEHFVAYWQGLVTLWCERKATEHRSFKRARPTLAQLMDPSWVQPAGVYLPFPIKNGVELDINEKAVVAAVIFNRFCKMRKPITPQYVAGTCEHFVWELVNYEGPDEVFEKHIPEINQSNLTLIVDCLKREFESSQDAKLQPKSVDPNRKTAVENAIKAINPERLNPTHKAIQNYLKKKGGSGMNTGMLTRILDELRLEDKYKGPSRSRKNDL